MENINQSPDSSHWYSRRGLFLAIILALLLGSVFFLFGKNILASIQAKRTVKQTATIAQNANLNSIANSQALLQKYNIQLSPNQINFLKQNNFLLLDASSTSLTNADDFDDMLSYFDKLGGNRDPYKRTQADAVLVTPDIVLHAYHKFFDIALKDLEKHQLSEQLNKFIVLLYKNADAQMKLHPEARDHYQKVLAQITVARVLMENQMPPKPDYFSNPIEEQKYLDGDKTQDTFVNAKKILAKYSGELSSDLNVAVEKELESIYSAKDVSASPLYNAYNPDVPADYTQYTPRSHYTETSSLRAYFRTMMYFGRNAYFFKTNDGITDAAIINELFNIPDAKGVKPADEWQKINQVTGFFVGQNDDLTFTEVSSWLTKVAPNSDEKIKAGDAKTTEQLAANLYQLRLPKILSDAIVSPDVPNMDKNDLLRHTLGFRIFGQKFTFDAWLYSQLTAGQEMSTPKLPSTPSALFIPAAFGDIQAKDYAKQFLKTDAGFSDAEANAFEQKLNDQTKAISAVDSDQWNSSLGSAWLNMLSTLTKTYGEKYPLYMQSPLFSSKQIQTFLGSYTELKHDTLLYAKQNYAEKGGGGDEDIPMPPIVRGYVEPNLEFWAKLNGLIDLTQKMFKENGLSSSQILPRLDNFKDQVKFYGDIAQKEMNGTVITDDEYEKLRTIQLSYMAVPLDNTVITDPKMTSSALVADISTDTVRSRITYEANAKPYVMLTLINDANQPRVTAGIAFNHYEFNDKLGGNRITDEDWKAQVYDHPEQMPAKNFWYQSLLVK